jgi:TPR repeat protein
MISQLKLPLSELKILYTRHLILKELLIDELSLYILSLCFLYKKQSAFDVYRRYSNDKENIKNILPFLESLEDRFINGTVSYRIGYCHEKIYYMHCSKYNIFIKQKQLSPEELFYMACIYESGNGGVAKNNEKAIELFKLSGDNGYAKAYVGLGCAYRDGSTGVTKNHAIAVTYFEKAAVLNYTAGKCHLAYMLEFGYGITKDLNRSKKLYISAAKDGDGYSIIRCKNMDWIF